MVSRHFTILPLNTVQFAVSFSPKMWCPGLHTALPVCLAVGLGCSGEGSPGSPPQGTDSASSHEAERMGLLRVTQGRSGGGAERRWGQAGAIAETQPLPPGDLKGV